MKFTVEFHNNALVRKGRPAFASHTLKQLPTAQGEDRRHIIHGATISDLLVELFNRTLQEQGINALQALIDRLLAHIKSCVRIQMPASFKKKIEKVITYAFGKLSNLVVGSSTANQGIEKARKSISTIRKELDNYCAADVMSFANIKAEALRLIQAKLNTTSGTGEVAGYRVWILQLLKQSVEKANDTVEIIKILADFEFSCTLDIVHDGTTKQQNIWGITTANRLQQAIRDGDNATILTILV